jgi:hypothetical protein
MTIDLLTVVYWVSLGFSLGVLVCELTQAPKPAKRKRPRRRRLTTHYLRGDDGLIFRVRCRPDAFKRMLAKIEDEECEGKG